MLNLEKINEFENWEKEYAKRNSIEIPLTQGKIAIVDFEDYFLLQNYKWCAEFNNNIWYAIGYPDGKKTRMHRFIMNAKEDQLIDHKNRNGLDNRKNNLRIATKAQNGINSKKYNRQNITSKYKGVSWKPKIQKWVSRIVYCQKEIYLGVYIFVK